MEGMQGEIAVLAQFFAEADKLLHRMAARNSQQARQGTPPKARPLHWFCSRK